MDSELNIEKKRLYLSIAKSMIVVGIIWVVYLLNSTFNLQWNRFGMQPGTLSGLIGIITMPFLHFDIQHITSNTLPMLFLTSGLFYYFPKKSLPILFSLLLISGIFTWGLGRGGVHVGASGLVYGLAFFLVTISLIKMETSLLAYTLVIVFLYGSLVWGFFPQLFPHQQISWEGHLSGAVAGVMLAFIYRKEGPVKKQYFEEEEEESDE